MTRAKGYQKAFSKFGHDVKSLQWKNEHAAEVRYRQIVKDIDLEGKSVLDVGCGFGDLVPFLEKKTSKLNYTGVDITPEFINIAQQKYSNFKFISRDYFNDPMPQNFDIVITSGTLNYQSEDPYKSRFSMIKTLWDHTNHTLVFNMAGGSRILKQGKRVFYADPLKILEFCYTLTNKVILRNNYHKKDFTVILFK